VGRCDCCWLGGNFRVRAEGAVWGGGGGTAASVEGRTRGGRDRAGLDQPKAKKTENGPTGWEGRCGKAGTPFPKGARSHPRALPASAPRGSKARRGIGAWPAGGTTRRNALQTLGDTCHPAADGRLQTPNKDQAMFSWTNLPSITQPLTANNSKKNHGAPGGHPGGTGDTGSPLGLSWPTSSG